MPKIDAYELEVLTAFEKSQLKSVATKSELAKFKAAARATGIKDRRVNIRLSSGDAVPNAYRQRSPQVRDRPAVRAAGYLPSSRVAPQQSVALRLAVDGLLWRRRRQPVGADLVHPETDIRDNRGVHSVRNTR